jgi:peptide/nickel transport system substrate-binding protein
MLTEFSSGIFATIERNDNYWGDLPPTRSMTFWTIPEMATRRVMLSGGEVQFVHVMSPEDIDDFAVNPDFNVIVDMGFVNTVSFKNGACPIMHDPNFRRAVAHALNFEDIAVVANGNWALPMPDGNMFSFLTPFRRDDLPRREYNLDLAREYLANSIYNGETIEFAVAGDANIRASEMIQLQLSMVGIDIDIQQMDVPSFVDAFLFNRDSERQMWLFSQTTSPSLAGTATGFFLPVGTNRVSLYDPVLTALVHEISSEANPERARELAYEMQQWLYDDMSYIPVYVALSGITTVRGVGGMHLWGDAFRYCLRALYWDLNQTPEHLQP